MNTVVKPIKKPNSIIKFFWWAAGGDPKILMRSTHSDRVKYTTLGGIIVATGLMAALAGGYAFYTIFGPKTFVLDTWKQTNVDGIDQMKEVFDYATVIKSTIFGLIWGLIIFNIDRFIVTSTGTGDGTEKITWGEFTGAIPRIVMGVIIAITISKPVEIRMFQTEIDQKLAQIQDDEMTKAQNLVDKRFKDDLAKKERKIQKTLIRINNLESQANVLQTKINYEITHGGCKEKCVEFKNQKAGTLSAILDEKNSPEYRKLLNEIDDLEVKRDKDRSNAMKKAASLDGLLKRIQIAHELDPWITLFITLLFMAIELTPIFFKLMLIKSPYDYLLDNEKELVKANDGIYIEYNYYDEKDHPEKEGIERHLVRFLNTERINIEKLELLEAQKRLTKYAVDKFEKQQKELIDNNPNLYIKIEPDQEENA